MTARNWAETTQLSISAARAWLARSQRLVAQLIWLGLALLLAALNLSAAPRALELLQTLCTDPVCYGGQVTPVRVSLLAALGLTVPVYGALNLAVRAAGLLCYTAISALIIWRRPTDRMAVLGAYMLLLDGTVIASLVGVFDPGSLAMWLGLAVWLLDVALVTCFFYLFPRGRFVAPWVAWAACLWVVASALTLALPVPWGPDWLRYLPTLQTDVWLLSLVAVQIYRHRTAQTPSERQQTRWIMLGVLISYGGYALLDLARFASQRMGMPSPWLSMFVTSNVLALLAPCVPLMFGMAILRARLYDIDIIIRRTLVYGALTVCVAAGYVLIVGALGQLVQAQAHPLIALVALGLIAISLQPLRAGLQRAVNQLVYGHRDEPYQVLARLGQRLGSALSAHEMLPTVAETLRETLRLPYAAISLEESGRQVIASASGAPGGASITIPLLYQHEPIGQLVLGQREPGEPFSARERRLLEDLAHHISIAARAVHLTRDLQISRERIVTAREEERRRLQRDLHDELGPTLASLTMQIDAARAMLADDPHASEVLLEEVQGQLKETVGNVRRLVHQLRPPVLDQFGLVAAVREYALHQQKITGLSIAFDAPESLPPLAAAVEVAAYYIVVEAVTNVIRHARAQRCSIRLRAARSLELEIRDDGVGLPTQPRSGVGLHSMHERAAELSGTWSISAAKGGGTQIRASLPL